MPHYRCLPVADATLVVRVKPGSKRPGIAADARGIVVRVAARPVDGAANESVRRTLAETLGVAPTAVTLVRGATSREKTFSIAGRSAAQLAAWRATLAGPDS